MLQADIEDVEDLAGGFDEANDLALNADQNGPCWRRRELDDDLGGQWLADFEDFFGHGLADDHSPLPTRRQVATASMLFRQAGRQSSGAVMAVLADLEETGVALNDFAFARSDDDLYFAHGLTGFGFDDSYRQRNDAKALVARASESVVGKGQRARKEE